jgi:two-component system cell cycle response regulator
MTARILVVDDILANVKLLEARLTAEYFDVVTASNGPDAIEICKNGRADIVLLDVMMPGMDGFEVCRRLKAEVATQHIPVIMVTALDQPSDRVQGLESGADDFLTKPVDEIALITRVRNLVRLKVLNDEMRMRAATRQELGILDTATRAVEADLARGRIMVVDSAPRSAQRLVDSLSKDHHAILVSDPNQALIQLAEDPHDVVLLSLDLEGADGLRLCSQIRSLERTRNLPVIVMVDLGGEARLLRALDMGVNDYLKRPVDRNEMLARIRTQIKRKRYADFLRSSLEQSVEQAITDALTGLHNRRYMETHLKRLVAEALQKGRTLSVLIADIDHFKSVNDTYGHDIGDVVLKEFARRLKRSVRGLDLACRLGGEEFVVIMPDTDLDRACQVAERIRAQAATETFDIGKTRPPLQASARVGVAAQARGPQPGRRRRGLGEASRSGPPGPRLPPVKLRLGHAFLCITCGFQAAWQTAPRAVIALSPRLPRLPNMRAGADAANSTK